MDDTNLGTAADRAAEKQATELKGRAVSSCVTLQVGGVLSDWKLAIVLLRD